MNLYRAAELATLYTLGSKPWRRLWRADGDHHVWARVMGFVGMGLDAPRQPVY